MFSQIFGYTNWCRDVIVSNFSKKFKASSFQIHIENTFSTLHNLSSMMMIAKIFFWFDFPEVSLITLPNLRSGPTIDRRWTMMFSQRKTEQQEVLHPVLMVFFIFLNMKSYLVLLKVVPVIDIFILDSQHTSSKLAMVSVYITQTKLKVQVKQFCSSN